MFDTILIPTDGSDHARRAAEHGLALADAFDASVRVIHVTDLEREGGPFDAGGAEDEFVERLESEGEEATAEIAAMASADRPVETEVVRGSLPEAIIEDAADHGADALVMGTHGRTGVRRYVAGSVTEYVVRHAEVPVLTARAADEPWSGYENVLVPTDGSDYALAAADRAIDVAGAFGATVHALHVVDTGALSPGPDSGVDAAVDQFREEGRSAVELIADRAADAGVEAVTDVREGSPPEAIGDYAAAEGVDLIVMGTRGRSGVERVLMGSTTERVIRGVPEPVLSIRAAGEE